MNATSDTSEIVLSSPMQGLVHLVLNRPERLNALTTGLMAHLHAVIDRLGADPSIRVVVISGSGRGFCAGLDLKALPEHLVKPGASVAEWTGIQEQFSGVVQKLRALDKVVIAAVHGVAVGVGFGLALAADIRITGRTTSFHVGAVKIGLSAGECGISYHLPRLIGASRAAELMLTGRPVDAAEAERIGLTGSVVEDNELVANALAMGSKVLQNSPYSTRHTKQLFWSNLEAPSLEAALQLENRTQIMALLTQDFQEAVAAFSEKRAPVFTGR